MNLPLTDGCLFIDNSMLESLKCPRLFYYQHVMKRVGSGGNNALDFGSAIHLALEHRYRFHEPVGDTSLMESEQAKVLEDFFAENPSAVEGDHRDLNFALEIIQHYNETYEYEPFNLLKNAKGEKLCEMSFAVPLYEHFTGYYNHETEEVDKIPVIYTGRIDLPVSWDDQIILMDNKTTSQLGAKYFDKFKMSAQMLGYCWAWQQSTGVLPHGYAINAIRTSRKTAKMINGLATKAEETKWWTDCFFRDREYISQWRVDEWKTNAINRIEELFWHATRDQWPMKTDRCTDYSRCPFFDCCYQPPGSREEFLQSAAFINNEWTPLTKKEKV